MKESLENFDQRMGHRTYRVSVPINRLRECWERRPWKKKGQRTDVGGRRSEVGHRTSGARPDEIDRAIDEAINEADRT